MGTWVHVPRTHGKPKCAYPRLYCQFGGSGVETGGLLGLSRQAACLLEKQVQWKTVSQANKTNSRGAGPSASFPGSYTPIIYTHMHTYTQKGIFCDFFFSCFRWGGAEIWSCLLSHPCWEQVCAILKILICLEFIGVKLSELLNFWTWLSFVLALYWTFWMETKFYT